MTNTEGPPSTLGRLHTVRSLSNFFGVSPRTIYRWVKDRQIVGRYKYQGGTRLKLFFEEQAVLQFMAQNMPTSEDLSLSYEPQTGKQKVEMIRRIRGMARAYAGRATSARLTKQLTAEYGITEDDLDDNENAKPATLDRGPARRWDMQSERPSGLDPTENECRDSDWDDDFEPKR